MARRCFGTVLVRSGVLAALAFNVTLCTCAGPDPRRDPSASIYAEAERGRPTHDFEIVVATYNVHGLPWPAGEHRSEAMHLIAEQLCALPESERPAVIAFQELWVPSYRSILLRELEPHGYTHSHFFSGQRFGTGMLVVSRLPIVETYLHSFDADAPWYRGGMDWWGAKGVGLARIALDDGSIVDIYDTHLVADYGGDEANDAERAAQGLELAQFVAATPAHVPCVVLGDFNCGPGDGEFDSMLASGGLVSIDQLTGRDHVLWRESTRLACELIGRSSIPYGIERDGAWFALSDHTCLVWRLRISPAAESSGSSSPK
jgi:endonuclease/exonuclease/phosphatase family metal-dependent hydrolase